MPIRLGIVDGHTLTRYGLHELILQYSDIEIVAECTSAAEASRVIGDVWPDVVTIDVALPDSDGLQLAREFRDRQAGLGIAMLPDEVISAIRHAAVAANSFTASGLALAIARRRAAQERLALSPRESEVLRLLRDGLSIPAISMAMFISQSTTKTYVARLYEKLGAANRSQALMTAVRHGLIDSEQHERPVLGPLTAGEARRPASAVLRSGPVLSPASTSVA